MSSSNATTGIVVNLSTGEVQTGQPQFRNRIINGDMRIDQRNSGTSANLTFNTSSYFIDRFSTNSTSYTAGSATIQRVTDAPTGFTNSYKITIGATPFSGGTNPYTWGVNQMIESYNLNDFQLGTINASPFNVSFWFKANNAGEYAITLIGYNVPTYSRYTTTFNIIANTWSYISKTIPSTGALSGTWNSSNDVGLQVSIGSYQGVAGNASILDVWGQGNVNSSTCFAWPTTANASIQVTGVQLEKGTKATPFEFRPYSLEMQLCQRYFETNYPINVPVGTILTTNTANIRYLAYVYSTNAFEAPVFFKIQKRVLNPTITLYRPSEISDPNKWAYWNGTAWAGSTTTNPSTVSDSHFYIAGVFGSFGQCLATCGYWTSSAEL